MVAIELPAPARITGVGLIPGYATGKDRFGENRRIREVRWHFDDGTAVAQRFQDQPTMQLSGPECMADRVIRALWRRTYHSTPAAAGGPPADANNRGLP